MEAKMILLYSFRKNRFVGTYKDFEEICGYFKRLEYFKIFGPSSSKPLPEGFWNFVYHPHKRLSAIFKSLKEDVFNEVEQEAYGNDFGLIEIYRDDPVSQQIIVTPDIDVGGLMRDCCFGYARANNYVFFEAIRGNLENNFQKNQ